MRAQLESWAPESKPIYPGTGFGPFTGRLRNEPGDFLWRGGLPYCPILMKRSAYEVLCEAGLRVGTAFETDIQGKAGRRVDIVQLDPPMAIILIRPESGLPAYLPCPVCRLNTYSPPLPELPPEQLVDEHGQPLTLRAARLVRSAAVPPAQVAETRWPQDWDICQDMAGHFCTESFVDAVRRLGLTDINFTEYKVVDPSDDSAPGLSG